MDEPPWIDVSMPIADGMAHWPGNPPVEVTSTIDGAAPVTRLSLGAHSGTHVDAPRHFVPGTEAIDAMPINATVGVARVVRIDAPVIHARDLEAVRPAPGERLLLRTRNSERPPSLAFDPDFVGLALDAAQLLAECRVRTIGIDYLSVAGFHQDGAAVHRALLEHGIWIIEGLVLGDVEPGAYDLVCLPLKLTGADGAPARAIVRPRR